ncbi:MAG: cupin domain-containing protein [Rhodocyclaceae bacterium]|nr:cupin domain-containing protein [Rhodocyclaceae bacterium]
MSKPIFPAHPGDPSNADEVARALAEALAPIAPDEARIGALRARLIQRARASRAADERVINVRREDGQWRALAKGVRVKMLCKGSRSVLVELAAGAALPTHRHHEHEECVVLRGEAQLGDLHVRRGDYHLAPAGSRHGRVSSSGGALLYLRGTSIGSRVEVARDLVTAWLPGAGASPITVRADEGEWRDFAPGVQAKSLWCDADARSMLLRLQPGACADAHAHSIDDECLMLEGEAFFGDTLLRAGDYRLAPAGTRHCDVVSDVGAVLFVRGATHEAARASV